MSIDVENIPQGGLPVNFGARAYDPTDRKVRVMNQLMLGASVGDWSWKPKRSLVITGPLCTLYAPVGTECERHSTYKAPTKNPRQTVIDLSN
jgi:hypothetical protein